MRNRRLEQEAACVLRVLYCSCADGPVRRNEGGQCGRESCSRPPRATPRAALPRAKPECSCVALLVLSGYKPCRAGPCRFRLRHHITFPPICVSFCLLRFSPSAATGKKRCNGLKNGKRKKFFVAEDCHPQTIALVETRGSAIGLDIVVSVHHRPPPQLPVCLPGTLLLVVGIASTRSLSHQKTIFIPNDVTYYSKLVMRRM